MVAGKKKKMLERSNLLYIKKLVKKSGASARGAVHNELNSMLTYVLTELTHNMNSITSCYSKKEETIKPKVVSAALSGLLYGELKTGACSSAQRSLAKFKTKAATKASKKSVSA